MKVYKIELLHIDFDGIGEYEGEEEIKSMIENARIGNHVYVGTIMNMESVDIGEWDDSNPLNNNDTIKAEYERLFKK